MDEENNIDKISYSDCKKPRFYYGFVKRFLDIFGSLVGIVILVPTYIIFGIIIKLDSPGPIIFRHKRIGQGGKEIKVFKFRTMVQNADQVLNNLSKEQKEEYKENFKLDNDPRITKVGKFLRETSIDELPQFINILVGQMSLVGPRPIVKREVEKYGIYAEKLFSVRPGLTGNWQANGRSETTYQERIMLDMDYINNRSLWKDFIILLKTVIVVFNKDGAK
ncbi:sugar transferase [Clostridium sp. 19966]|uniref:sugar transferase n=1 Tax=Clostridium sp. 19966 TaxID=2768166 RepID=UPI0028DF90D2|nr:sugar transferase [Clostridium sp. 19966]MDT8716164.1 sugar transferase [Clostridium sp. 19966]